MKHGIFQERRSVAVKGKDLINYVTDNGLEETPVKEMFKTAGDIAKEEGITPDGVRAQARRGKRPPLFKLGDGGELFFPLNTDKQEDEEA